MDAGTYLHRARLARGLSLEDLVDRTSLRPAVLKKIDEGRFAELPAGLYARAYIRTFAREVGAEPEVVLETLAPLLPAAPDPLPVMREVRAANDATLHLQLARISAATFDALLLILAVVLPIIWLAAWTSGVEVAQLLADAGGALGAFCALPLALYFLVFDGIGGGTPGCRAFGLCENVTPAPLRLPDILKRALSH